MWSRCSSRDSRTRHGGTSMSDQEPTASLAVRVETVRDWLRLQESEIARALPKGMEAERFARMVLTSCVRNPRLLDCSRQSLMLAVMECAALGLEPDNVGGFAY